MKRKKTRNTQGVFILCVLMILFFSACKKDDIDDNGNNNPIPGEGSRLSGWKYYEDGFYATNVILSYSANKLTEVAYYDQFKNGNESRIMNVDYQGNLATVIDRWPDGNGGYAIDGKTTIEFSGNNVVDILEYEYSDGSYHFDYRSAYTYVNDMLNECIYYYYDSQSPSGKCVKTYSGARLTLSETYNYDGSNFQLFAKTEWHYSGDNISLIEYKILNDTAWVLHGKDEFTYQGNVIIMNDYEYVSGSWELKYETEITKDANGNTVKIIEKDLSWDDEITVEFSYTSGSGNFDDILLSPEDKSFPFILPFKK